MLYSSLSASNEEKKVFEQIFNDVTMCCVDSASTGTDGTAGYVKITIKKCATSATGDRAAAYVSACANAKAAANNALRALGKVDLIIIQP